MKINFRQGLISYQHSGAQAVFLLPGTSPNTVALSVSPQPTLATIAHGSSDYFLKFDQTVLNAWALVPGVNNWLFIDQNLINGILTYGVTTFEPIISLVAPVSPSEGQMWFDLAATVMKTFTGQKWIVTPRLVVGKVIGGNTNQIQSYPTGSSVGLSVPGSPGLLMLDSQLRPLRTSTGELLTSDTPIRLKTTVGTTGVLTEPVNNFVPVRANEPIPAMSLVYLSGEDSVSLASSNPALVILKSPIGLIEHDLAKDEVGVIIQQGEITYDQWDWPESSFGKPLYCGFFGELTTTRPLGIQAYRVGYIKNARTILFYIDSETLPQVVSSPGSIISGVPPILANTTANSSGESITSISMIEASPYNDGYMSASQAALVQTFDNRITTNEADILLLEANKANVVHTHIISDVIELEASLLNLNVAIDARVPKIIGTTGNFPSINSDGTLLDSSYSYDAFALVRHVHTIADVTNLQSTLNAKADVVHTHIIADVTGLQANLDSRAFVNHTHVISDVSGLQTALNNKAALVHNHVIVDVTGLQDQLDLRSLVGHSHVISDVANLQTVLNSKAALIHTHVIADTTGLQTALDSKAALVHTHVSSDVTDFTEAVQDVIGTTIVAGAGVVVTYNDIGNELIIASSITQVNQLKVRSTDATVYVEYEPTVALAFPSSKVQETSSGLIAVSQQKLSMFQGLTPLTTYPNANVDVESKIVFGAGLQAMRSGDDNEVVTIQTAPISGFLPLSGGSLTGNLNFTSSGAITLVGDSGVAGQVLTSGGASQPMTWANPSTGGGIHSVDILV